MVQIKGKIFKQGNGYALRIPKVLVDCLILPAEEELVWELEQKGKRTENNKSEAPATGKNGPLSGMVESPSIPFFNHGMFNSEAF